MREKFKSFIINDQLFYGAIIVVVGIGSFGLGKMTNTTNQETPLIQVIEPIIIDNSSNSALVTETTKTDSQQPMTTETQLIASKKGTKYHLSTCPGAKQIKHENRIYFTSKQQAEAAGYKKAANCPDLQKL
jgi:hypothetical protein